MTLPPTRKLLALAGAAAVLVGAFAVHAAAGPSAAGGYRTATVGTSDVDQTLDGVGTVEPVTQASVAFPVAGTVATVDVTVGAPVVVGQTLATLDPASLDVTIHAKQAAVDQAALALAKARSGSSTSSTSSAGRTGSPPGPSTGDSPQLAAAQQAVVTGQRTVDADLQSAQQAFDEASRICAAAGSPTGAAPADASTTSTTAIGDEPDPIDAPPAAAPDTSAIEACRTALQDVLDAQQRVADAQAALGQAASAYDEQLEQRAVDLASAAPSSSVSSSAPSSAGPGASTTASSADLIKLQKAVDAADAELAVAQQALKQAAIVSPIAGTVATVGLAPDDTVTAGSTTATVVIVGEGGVEVTMTVAVDKLPAVDVGQSATITPDGGRSARTGKVVAIGVAATSSSGATTYPVIISLPADTTGLRNGSVAAVSIVTKAASGALVVPTSAVSAAGTARTVQVLDGSKVTTTRVQVGAVGTAWTEVTSGLTAGQRVVLAALNAPLPTSATQVSTRNGGGTGNVRFPGGLGGAFPGRRVAAGRG